eukprot:CAMPEP_0197039066 /NCGR_PEP_ID=MMETSP1384-20130603/15927_1 /TAXON_ID=29189 /ORGANISM="Ammonia sp." /LENGTH=154 /DNA_ID=CAMNT_0042469607 /DNA_START=11 /DNA_END=472 /DNA_ORIENTATION=-
MCNGGCDWGIVWSVFNFICGLGIVLGHFSLLDACAWLRVIIGVSICWVAITHQLCDQYALAWFPFWEKAFIFMGCTFLFFSCGAWNRGCWNDDNDRNNDNCGFFENFAAFFLWFTFVVGVLYLILGFIEFCGAASIPHPTPLVACCGGGGGGGG